MQPACADDVRFAVLLDRFVTPGPQKSGRPVWPLPEDLRLRYGGPLGFSPGALIVNFVATLDGVTSFGEPDPGGGEVSGFNAADRFLMGLLRACADVVVIGANTLRAEHPDYLWNSKSICPAQQASFAKLRCALGKPEEPALVVVSQTGNLPLERAVFQSPPVVVLTTQTGAKRLGRPPTGVTVLSHGDATYSGHTLATQLRTLAGNGVVLCEGGPQLLSALYQARQVDELFLTLAPQLAGRSPDCHRPALVEGHAFSPKNAPWLSLVGVRNAGEHLFLHYATPGANKSPKGPAKRRPQRPEPIKAPKAQQSAGRNARSQ